jgi:ribosomal protein S18 acetylase RimI-like enzyme
MQVRRAVPGDEPILRWLRLEALTDTPDAFGSTLEREQGRPDEDWERWIDPGPMWLLEDEGTPLGLSGVVLRAEGLGEIVAVWIQEQARGSGAAEVLLQAALDWAEAEGLELVLHVTESNVRAQRFYERMGFELTGASEARARDGVVEREMRPRPTRR